MKLTQLLILTVTILGQSYAISHAQSPETGKKPSPQVIIFKFDDLSEKTQMAFQRVADILAVKDCKGGFGIVGRSLEGGTEKVQYFNRVKDFNTTGRIEIWAHGYDHFMNGDTLTEFRNSPYEKQFDHFKRTLDLVYEKCGITIHTFGTPGNKADSSTTRVINQFPQVQVYLFPFLRDPALKQHLLTSRVDMEQGTGKMNYDFFVRNFNNSSERKYMVLQGHPGVWKEDGFETLSRIIDFLKTREAIFMTPYEYSLLLKRQ